MTQDDPYYRCPRCDAVVPAAWWAHPAGSMRPPVELGCPICRTDHVAATMAELLPLDVRTSCPSCGHEVTHPVGAIRAHCTSRRCGALFDPHDRPRRAQAAIAIRSIEAEPEPDVRRALFGKQLGDDRECE